MAGTLARCKGHDPTRFYISQECSRGLRKEPGRGLGLTKVLFHLVPTLFMVYLVYLIGNINTLPVIFFVKDLYWVMMRRLQRRSQSGAAKPESNLSLFFFAILVLICCPPGCPSCVFPCQGRSHNFGPFADLLAPVLSL